MRRKKSTVLIGVLFLIGFGVLVHPILSGQWDTYRQGRLISKYERAVSRLEPEDLSHVREKAKKFNKTITNKSQYSEVFEEDGIHLRETEYWKTLNVCGNGVMGYLSIPKIECRLSIYHDTGNKGQKTRASHINGTKLPIGGTATHSVLSIQRSSSPWDTFTYINQLEEGDKFYIHILDRVLAYKINLKSMKSDIKEQNKLQSTLSIETGRDYITLLTCPAYGAGSDTLLIRGSRVAYNEQEEAADSILDSVVLGVKRYYMLYFILGLGAVVFRRYLLILLCRKRKRRLRKKKRRILKSPKA